MEVFERFEKKYLLDQARYEALLPLLLPHMEADVFPESRIGSIYYDTKTCLLIRRSLEKPLFKEKLQLRAYSLPAEDTRVFLEMKRKYKGLGYKRRAALPYGKALRFLAGEAIPEADSQIFRELRSFLSRYPDLRPCMFIGSDRLSYRGQERKDLRITLDRNIRYRREDPYLHLGFHGAPLLEEGEQLMEIKCFDPMPLFLSRILSELAIYPFSYSKYGRAYEQCLLKKEVFPYVRSSDGQHS